MIPFISLSFFSTHKKLTVVHFRTKKAKQMFLKLVLSYYSERTNIWSVSFAFFILQCTTYINILQPLMRKLAAWSVLVMRILKIHWKLFWELYRVCGMYLFNFESIFIIKVRNPFHWVCLFVSQETHIIHQFDNDFYGSQLSAILTGYLRPEQSYPSLG